jgi:hypothetical protein
MATYRDYLPSPGAYTGQNSGGGDPYTKQLQDIMGAMNSGNYPGYTITGGSNISRVTPEEEAGANQTAFGGLDMTNFGNVPEQQLSNYYSLAQPYMFGQGMENIDQILASSGYGVGGSQAGGVQGGFEGARAEMGGRLQASLGSQIAQMLAQNAQTGATAQANAQLGIGQSRYAALTKPNATSLGVTKGPGVGSAVVNQNDPTKSDSSGSGGAGGGTTAGRGGGGGVGNFSGSPDWWQTSYGSMNNGAGAAWNASQPGYYGSGDQAVENYWNQNMGGSGYSGLMQPESDYYTPESGGSGPAGAGTQAEGSGSMGGVGPGGKRAGWKDPVTGQYGGWY